VTLEERYNYQYNEIAEIICKRPHYVTAKAGLAKRLTSKVKALALRDWEMAKCGPTTVSDDAENVEEPYRMNVNVIERIARMPHETQKQAYEAIRADKMEKKEAMGYLRNIQMEKVHDVQGINEAAPEVPESHIPERPSRNNETKRYFTRIHRDIDRLVIQVKSGYIEREDARQELEALIQRLNALSAEITVNDNAFKVLV
jgi:hypothetical protein